MKPYFKIVAFEIKMLVNYYPLLNAICSMSLPNPSKRWSIKSLIKAWMHTGIDT